MSIPPPDFEKILREKGLKATPGRVHLLETLFEETTPVTVPYLQKKLTKKLGGSLDKVTLYRSLQLMTTLGLVREVDFRHGHAHYELNVLRPHHHHVVCTRCGVVSDVDCSVSTPPKKPASFNKVTDHAVEFFGICKTCAPRLPSPLRS